MPATTFNITQLIRELGLKNVDSMDVVERLQPVVTVADLSDLTPAHQAPKALFGAFIAAVVAERFVMEVQCLAPGGLFVDWLAYDSTGNLRISINATAVAGALPVVAPVGQASRDPVRSIVREGTLPGAVVPGMIVRNEHTFPAGSIGLFVPRAQFFLIQSASTNIQGDIGFTFWEVPATESAPS